MVKKSLDGISRRKNRKVGFDDRNKAHRTRASLEPLSAVEARNSRLQIGNFNNKSTEIDQIIKTKNKKQQNDTEDFLQPVNAFDFDDADVEKMEEKLAKKEAKKQGKKWSKKRKIITFSLLGIFLILLGVSAFYLNDLISKLTSGNSGLGDVISAVVNEYVDLKTDENGRTNLLVIGTSGYDMDGSGHDGAQLSDTIMIVSFYAETGDVAMVSIPRDLKVSNSCYSTGKINEIYSCGSSGGENDAAGASALAETIEEITGVKIQYYAHVDWQALVEIVDTLGGITVTLDDDVADYNYSGTVISAGVPTDLNGEAALNLARARHGTTGGDFTRNKNQQIIIEAIIQKAQTENISISKALSIVNTLGDNLRTDFTVQEMKTILHYGESFSTDNLRQVPLYQADDGTSYVKTASINGISYVIPSLGAGNYTDIRAYIAKQLSTNGIEREEAQILVLNGSGAGGAASSEEETLKNEGYYVADIGDAWDTDFTGITIYKLNSDKPETIRALEKFYNTTAKNADDLPDSAKYANYDIVVVVGATV